jgi:hypothetical protein
MSPATASSALLGAKRAACQATRSLRVTACTASIERGQPRTWSSPQRRLSKCSPASASGLSRIRRSPLMSCSAACRISSCGKLGPITTSGMRVRQVARSFASAVQVTCVASRSALATRLPPMKSIAPAISSAVCLLVPLVNICAA